jgi:hypothetical protein
MDGSLNTPTPMSRPQMWFTKAPGPPVAITGDTESLLYSASHGQGWATLTRPIPDHGQESADAAADGMATTVASTIGGFLHVMAYRLEQVGVPIPTSLHTATNDAPAGEVGSAGRPAITTIDGQLRYTTAWQFDDYRAIATIISTTDGRPTWVAALAPAPPIALQCTKDFRPISW